MKKLLLFFALTVFCFKIHANSLRPSFFIDVNTEYGTVLNTDRFISDIQSYRAASIRFARAASGRSWQDFAFNMPFFGIGLYVPYFENNPGLGRPFSLYFFRGSTIRQFTNNFGLTWELNTGLSMNWNRHDPVDNPQNITIGSSNNVHIGLGFFFEYSLTRHFDLKLGAKFNHFSNGGVRMPNGGINTVALSLSAAYNINPPNRGFLLRHPPMTIPPIRQRIDHEMSLIVSSRQSEFLRIGSRFVDHNFLVLGLVYSPKFVINYRFKVGPFARVIYDASSQATARREQDISGQWVDRVHLAPMSDRLSLGIGISAEKTLPVVSVFGKLGYSVYHRHHSDLAFFQTIGAKVNITDNLFGTFGVSSTRFRIAQFLYWSVGYRIPTRAR